MVNVSKRTATFDQFRNLFAVDARSLAILRILIALIIFVESIYCFGALARELTEANGVLTQLSSQDAYGAWSICWLSESDRWVWICVLIKLIGSISLLFGFRTFLVTAVCLVMSWSLQVSNPSIGLAGNELLRMVLFWGLFLPWGSCWSVDSTKNSSWRPDKWTVVSCGTAGIMLQLASVYFFSGIANHLSGHGVENWIQTTQLNATSFGSWITGYSATLEWAHPFILTVFIAGSVLLFVPYVHQYWRGVMMALLLLGHIGTGLWMQSGIFSVVAIATWFVFVPGSVWNILLGTPPKFDMVRRTGFHSLRQGWQGVCLAFVLFVLTLNILDVVRIENEKVTSLDRLINGVANITMTQQDFRMFARTPKESRGSRVSHKQKTKRPGRKRL